MRDERFSKVSSLLTGFDAVRLQGTGMMTTYYDVVEGAAGVANLRALLDVAAGLDPGEVRARVLEAPCIGPVALRLIRLWMTGSWKALPETWHGEFGGDAQDADHVVSPASYRAGLVWTCIGAHPQAARQPGFGTWAEAPKE